MPAAHEVGELALDQRPGGAVVVPPRGIPGGGTTGGEERLVRADLDRAAPWRGRAAARQRTRRAGATEAGVPLPVALPERSNPPGRAGDGPGRKVDRELILGEAARERVGGLDLAAADGAGILERLAE